MKSSSVKEKNNNKADVIAIVLAAGKGMRMGGEEPKQFADVCGRSVLSYSLETFEKHKEIDAIVVVCPRGYKGRVKDICARHGIKKCIKIVAGGDSRRDSSEAGVNAAVEIAKGSESIVLIHDSARPLISSDIISKNIMLACNAGACITAAPAVDTVVLSKDGKTVESVPDRSQVWCVQTPQSFKLGVILDAHAFYCSIAENERPAVTDDGGLVRLTGKAVAICPSDNVNFKITLPGDIERMRAIIEEETKSSEFRVQS